MGLMLRDALLLANDSPHVTLLGHASIDEEETSPGSISSSSSSALSSPSSSPLSPSSTATTPATLPLSLSSSSSSPPPESHSFHSRLKGRKLKLSECGGLLDRDMNGYMQLVDGTVLALVRSAALMEEEEGIVHEDGNGKGEGKMIKGRRKGDEDSERGKDDEQDNLLQHASAPSSSSSTLSHLGPAQRASALLARIEKRELYKFVGGALLSSGMESAIDVNGPNGAGRAAADLNQVREWENKVKKKK